MIPARVNFSNQKPCTNLKWIFCHHSRFCRHMTASVWAIVWLTQPWSSLDGLLSSLASILEAFSLILENGGNQSVKTLLKWCMKSCRFIRVWTYLIKEEHGEVHPSLVNHDIIAWTERSNPHFSTSDISWFNLMPNFDGHLPDKLWSVELSSSALLLPQNESRHLRVSLLEARYSTGTVFAEEVKSFLKI